MACTVEDEERFFTEGIFPVLAHKKARVLQISALKNSASAQIIKACKLSVPNRIFFVYSNSSLFIHVLETQFTFDIRMDPSIKVTEARSKNYTLEFSSFFPNIQVRFCSFKKDLDLLRGLDFDVFVFVELPAAFRTHTKELLELMAENKP